MAKNGKMRQFRREGGGFSGVFTGDININEVFSMVFFTNFVEWVDFYGLFWYSTYV